jgi:1-acyl-sn-glycerol-3-phosphate acyltransferase
MTARLRVLRGLPDAAVMEPGYRIACCAEKAGSELDISGLRHLQGLEQPAVIIANHMSTFETLILPVIAGGRRPLSFVLKESLPKYPIFGPVVLAGRPIVVGRTNPREDLRVVLHEGMARLEAGRNVVVFPQGHRRPGFEAENFNSMGIKLAKRAGVLVVPLALMTDFWSEGRRVKDVGPIYPDRPVRFAFGKPLEVVGNGKEQHAQCVDFIAETLKGWGIETR